MELSQIKTQEAKKLKVSVQEMVMADLISIGYSDDDAYTIAYPENIVQNVQLQKANITEILTKSKFKHLCETRREKNASYLSVSNNTDDIELITPEDVAKEVLQAAKMQPIGSKERADLMAKYNDIRNENKKDIADPNNDPVQFFFPIACEKCPLLQTYNDFIAKKNEGKPKGKWIVEVRPDEMQLIMEIAHPDIQQMRNKKNIVP